MTVSGSLSCSDVLSLDGYGGSARELTLKAGSRRETLTFPFKLRSGSIFKPPTYQKYRFRVDIPQDKNSVELNWSLSCWAQDGSKGSSKDGSFSVERKDLSRTICTHGGLGNPCGGPEASARAGEYAYAIVTVGTGSTVLDWFDDLLLDPPESKIDTVLASAAHTNPIVGIVLACGKLALNNKAPASPPAPTVAALPTSLPPPLTTLPQAPQPPAPPPPAPQPTQGPFAGASAASATRPPAASNSCRDGWWTNAHLDQLHQRWRIRGTDDPLVHHSADCLQTDRLSGSRRKHMVVPHRLKPLEQPVLRLG